MIGGRDFSATVNSGGLLKVISGGSATGASIGNGGHAVVSGGGRESAPRSVVAARLLCLPAVPISAALSTAVPSYRSSAAARPAGQTSLAWKLFPPADWSSRRLSRITAPSAVLARDSRCRIASRTSWVLTARKAFLGGTDIRGTVGGGGREFILSGGMAFPRRLPVTTRTLRPSRPRSSTVVAATRTVVSSGGVLVDFRRRPRCFDYGQQHGYRLQSGRTGPLRRDRQRHHDQQRWPGRHFRRRHQHRCHGSSGGGLFVHSGLASRTTLSGGLE